MFRIRLKELREHAGYSQAAFAERINVSQPAVGHWESGTRKPDLDTLLTIADFFGVSVDYLLCHEAPIHSPSEAMHDMPTEEKEILRLWRNATHEGRKAARIVLESQQRPSRQNQTSL